jgi:predicted pyridoxine 5'-phosphate oxidase superfamily flavin-nucleotide-binding protein
MTASFYRRPEVLERKRHALHRIHGEGTFAFVRHTTSLPASGAEFADLSREFPIVFTQVGNAALSAVVILGLRGGENLYVSEQSLWTASYVPAFVRRYPFVLAETSGPDYAVAVDEAYEGFNTARGERLFDEAGQPTEFLNNALQFLMQYQQQFARTTDFCARLQAMGLLTDMDAKADLFDGTSFTVRGLKVVDERRIAQLSDADAARMTKSGELGWIYAHLISLGNFQRLVDRMAARKRAAV